jgi:hypothetical protein
VIRYLGMQIRPAMLLPYLCTSHRKDSCCCNALLSGTICSGLIDNGTNKIERVGIEQEIVAVLIAIFVAGQITWTSGIREWWVRSGCALRRRQRPACSLIRVSVEGLCEYLTHRFYPN